MKKSILRLAVLSSPLLLGACGEGWEAQKTTTAFPYGNERTAGSGVIYVRAKMLPKKELKIEAIAEVEAEPEVKPVLDAEEIFTEQQTKGSTSVAKVITEKKIEEKIIEEVIETEDHSSVIAPIDTKKISAEDFIAQEPTNKAQTATLDVSEIEPLAGDSSDIDMDAIERDFGIAFDEGETIEIYENKVSQPLKQIIVPKKDFMDLRTQGEKSLDEIYNDAFINSF